MCDICERKDPALDKEHTKVHTVVRVSEPDEVEEERSTEERLQFLEDELTKMRQHLAEVKQTGVEVRQTVVEMRQTLGTLVGKGESGKT